MPRRPSGCSGCGWSGGPIAEGLPVHSSTQPRLTATKHLAYVCAAAATQSRPGTGLFEARSVQASARLGPAHRQCGPYRTHPPAARPRPSCSMPSRSCRGCAMRQRRASASCATRSHACGRRSASWRPGPAGSTSGRRRWGAGRRLGRGALGHATGVVHIYAAMPTCVAVLASTPRQPAGRSPCRRLKCGRSLATPRRAGGRRPGGGGTRRDGGHGPGPRRAGGGAGGAARLV